MLENMVQEVYIKSYGAVTINDPSIPIEELGNRIIDLIPENYSEKTIGGIISDIIKAGVPDKGLKVIEYLLEKKPEWNKALFLCKTTCLTLNNNLEQLINETKEYESRYGRDQNTMIALLNAYLTDGYVKHEREIRRLTAELKSVVEDSHES